MPDPIFPLLISVLLALLLGHAALTKWRGRAEFGAVLEAYALVPRALVGPLSWLVPLTELCLAGLMLCAPLRAGGGLGAALLFAGYGLAIGINLARGRRDLDCGCTGPGERRPIAAWMVWRNGALALLAASLALPVAARPLGLGDLLTLAGGTLGFTLLYLALDRLLSRSLLARGVTR